MIRARQRPVWNAVAIDIGVSPETAQPFQIIGRKDLSTIEFLFRIFEGIRHPIIHAQIEITHDENRRLKPFGKIERVVRHLETFFDARRQQNDMLRIAMRSVSQRQNVGLLSSCR